MAEKHYRLCAGAVVFNREGKVLLGCRSDVAGENWQLPQGGIEKGEKPWQAAKRELAEETSVVSVKLVYQSEQSHCYDFTEEIKNNFRKRGIISDGQDICFSLFFFEGKDSEINLNTDTPEFNKYMWADLDFAAQNIVSFKKDVYLLMAKDFNPRIKQFLDGLS